MVGNEEAPSTRGRQSLRELAGGEHVSEIAELGHTGLWVFDLAAMKQFYTQVLGLQVTDEDTSHGIVFLSSRPGAEHHELVLQSGRDAAAGAKVVHQISWRLRELEDLIRFHRRFVAAGVRIEQTVTHGNALGVYFFDPEGNRNEVYWQTGEETPQPYRKVLNLDQDSESVLRDAAALLSDGALDFQPASGAARDSAGGSAHM